MDGNAALSVIVPAHVGERVWLRFDVYDCAEQMLAVTNPIFFGLSGQSVPATVGEFLTGI